MKSFEHYKRLIKLLFSFMLVALLTGVYGIVWIGYYNKIIWAPIFSQGATG